MLRILDCQREKFESLRLGIESVRVFRSEEVKSIGPGVDILQFGF